MTSIEALRQANAHMLADPAAQTRVVELANARAFELGLVALPEPAFALAARPKVSLGQWQTKFQDQKGRGSCYVFAACAAMEAAYRRQFGVVVDISEQYVFHINKVTALLDGWVESPSQIENNSTLDGFQGSSDMVDKLARFAAPAEPDAPYLSEAQMFALRDAMPAGNWMTQQQNDAFEFNNAVVPMVSHQLGRYQVESFAALPNRPSIEQVKQVLQAGYEVVADVKDHCFLIVGYDDNVRQFEIKNSWDEHAFIYESYDNPKFGPVLGGRYITKVRPISAPQTEAAWMGHWYIDHDGWNGELMIRRFTNLNRPDTEPTKLGDYYRDGTRHDVNGSVTDNGSTMSFWIAETTDRTEPGSQVGQHFIARFCANDLDNAAGSTEFNGVQYGVRLSRKPFSHDPIGFFDVRRWIDGWSISQGGARAEVLRISSVKPLEGSYERDGLNYDIVGNVDPNHDHVLHFKVPFDPVDLTTYQLFHHTREDGAVSGFCVSPGSAVGVQADRHIEPYYPPFAPPGPGVMVSFIYAIPPNGILQWFRHEGARHGAFDWKGARPVGKGWSGWPAVIPGGGDVIYAVNPSGDLIWYEHVGFNTGAGLQEAGSWNGRTAVNHGFGEYARIFSGGNGVIYGITHDGRLIWHRHHGVATGIPVEVAGSWSGPKEVGVGWNGLSNVFGGGDGIIYGVNADGDLVWFNHLGHREGLGHNDAGGWSGNSVKPVGRGWSSFTTLFSSGNGVIYGLQHDGILRWHRHLGYQTGAGLETPGSWEGGIDVGWGWGNFDTLFALIPRDSDLVH